MMKIAGCMRRCGSFRIIKNTAPRSNRMAVSCDEHQMRCVFENAMGSIGNDDRSGKSLSSRLMS